MANPELLKMPFAQDGDKATIPETTDGSTGIFSQQYGFQSINSLPLQAGGKAVRREDFNGAFNMLSNIAFYAQKGFSFEWDATQSYFKGCVVIDPTDDNRYECVADVAAGGDAPHLDTDNWRRYTLGDGVAVGIILPFAGNGAIPAGYLLCDGSAVSRTMFPDLFAAIGTIYGAGDGSTTFNVPDYNTAARFAQGSTVAGIEIAAGLPNITGSFGVSNVNSSNGTRAEITGASGAIAVGAVGTVFYSTSSGSRANVPTSATLDASLSNSIYGNSTTVQPNALTTRYIIKAFDGQTADSALVDITQYAQELAGKATITGSNLVHHRDVITTSGTYTAPVTGLYKITVKGGGGGGQGGAKSTNFVYTGTGGAEGGTTIAYAFMEVGDIVTVVIGAGGAGGASVSSGTSGSNGSNGGDSSVTVNSNTYTGDGGAGGTRYSSNGGTGTIPGCAGGMGSTVYYQGTTGNAGGAGGGAGGTTNGINGVDGGGGAGGTSGTGSSAITKGGAGGDGFVWFEYYTPGS